AKATDALGFLMHMEHSKNKEQVLAAARDTHYNSTAAEFFAIAEDLGFEEVLMRPFTYNSGFHDSKDKILHKFVFVHPEGVVLTGTTWNRGGYTDHEGTKVPVSVCINSAYM